MLDKIKATLYTIVFGLFGLLLSALDPVIKVAALLFWLLGSGKFKQWGFNVWFATDNYFSAVLGGDSEETVSSRLGKAQLAGSGWTPVADKVDLIAYEFTGEIGHCVNSIEPDEGETQVTGR